MTKIIQKFDEIASNYKAIFCDLWGCLHNGQTSFSDSLNTLISFKRQGGAIILLTNAPRPKHDVATFIDKLGINKDCYDDLVTSGDAAQISLFLGKYGTKIFHIGPERDYCFFDIDPALLPNPISLEFVDIDEASCIVCTGLFNDRTETPQDYNDIIRKGINLNLDLLCVNPDIQVDYGNRRLWCAGAIAENYKKQGGSAHYFGKPYKPIYDLALQKLNHLDPTITKNEILCIGDGISTDISGGIFCGFDTLFVCGGLSDRDTGTTRTSPSPDSLKLSKFLKKLDLNPTASIGYLR